MQIDFHCSNLTLSLDCVFRWPRTMCWCGSRSVAFFSLCRLLRLVFLTFTFRERDARALLFFASKPEIVISLLPKKRLFYNNRRKSVLMQSLWVQIRNGRALRNTIAGETDAAIRNCLIWPDGGDKYWSAKIAKIKSERPRCVWGAGQRNVFSCVALDMDSNYIYT